MEPTMRKESEKAMQDLGEAVREGEAALKNGATGLDARAKLQAAIGRATAAYERLREKTVAAAKATDEAVREHPYHAAGIAFGVGLLVGVLATRYRNRE